ncbi:MAG: hypothetical protein ABR510_04800 [Trueperaceae bacterium]
MVRTDAFAYLLIGLGALALLARLTDGAGWLWLGLVAAALLVAYVQQRTYGFLVLGSILAGSTVGLLLQAAFPRCDGVFLIALGMGLVAIDRVEQRAPRWPWGLGLALVGIGVVSGLASSGLLSSTWFALLLIAAGALLLWRRRESAAFPPQVRGGPGPRSTPDAQDPPSD